MASLRDVLQLHDRAATSDSLEGNLGDGWLLRHNEVYRRIRSQTVSLGFTFVSEGPLVSRYLAFSLLCLEEILQSHAVPYVDNVAALRSFATRAPQLTLPASLLTGSMRTNMLLHESAHAVAHSSLFGPADLRAVAATDSKDALVRMSLAEAFANAIEDASALSCTRGAHALFFKLNSYFAFEPNAQHARRALVERFGQRGVFRGALASYVLANLRPSAEASTEPEREAIMRWMNPGGSACDANDPRINDFSNRALTLCPSFRRDTAELHHSFLGIVAPLAQLGELNFAEVLADASVRHMAEALVDLASEEVDSEEAVAS